MRVIRYGKLASALQHNGTDSSRKCMLDDVDQHAEHMHETPYGLFASEATTAKRSTLRRYASDPGSAANANLSWRACLTNPLLIARGETSQRGTKHT